MVTVRNSDTHFESPEPGSYPATCYKLIDLGTQESEYQGKAIKRRQVIIGWELAEKMSTGDPFVVSAFYTASLSEKSKLRPILESWRGASFTAEELEGFDLGKLLGKSCLVSLVINDKGKTRVSTAMKLPKGVSGPVLVNKVVHFDLDKFDQVVFDSLSDKLKDMIKRSPEYALVGAPKSAFHEEDPVVESEPEHETEVPF